MDRSTPARIASRNRRIEHERREEQGELGEHRADHEKLANRAALVVHKAAHRGCAGFPRSRPRYSVRRTASRNKCASCRAIRGCGADDSPAPSGRRAALRTLRRPRPGSASSVKSGRDPRDHRHDAKARCPRGRDPNSRAPRHGGGRARSPPRPRAAPPPPGFRRRRRCARPERRPGRHGEESVSVRSVRRRSARDGRPPEPARRPARIGRISAICRSTGSRSWSPRSSASGSYSDAGGVERELGGRAREEIVARHSCRVVVARRVHSGELFQGVGRRHGEEFAARDHAEHA